jgi:hypothetical protein
MGAFQGCRDGFLYGRGDGVRCCHCPAATPPAQRNDFAGITELLRVEDLPEAMHDLQVIVAEQPGHAISLFQAYAVLATQDTSKVNAGAQDGFPCLQHALDFLGIPLVIQHQWVQIAITSMEDIGNTQTVGGADLLQLAQSFRQTRTWNDTVMRIVIRTQASHRPERFLASLPEQSPLCLVFGNADALTAMLLTERSDT